MDDEKMQEWPIRGLLQYAVDFTNELVRADFSGHTRELQLNRYGLNIDHFSLQQIRRGRGSNPYLTNLLWQKINFFWFRILTGWKDRYKYSALEHFCFDAVQYCIQINILMIIFIQKYIYFSSTCEPYWAERKCWYCHIKVAEPELTRYVVDTITPKWRSQSWP